MENQKDGKQRHEWAYNLKMDLREIGGAFIKMDCSGSV
jgi:hypothetical protein